MIVETFRKRDGGEFYAVQIGPHNIKDAAKWCNGHVVLFLTDPENARNELAKAMEDGAESLVQRKVGIYIPDLDKKVYGFDWIVYDGGDTGKFSVYTPNDFTDEFEEMKG